MGECPRGKHGEKKKLPHGMLRCLRCGKVYPDRTYHPRHGSYRGYQKHRRERKGNWAWPIAREDPCGCMRASREYHAENNSRPENAEARRERGKARQAAFLSLRRTFPALYTQFYVQEIEKRRGDGLRQPPRPEPSWDGLVARLVEAALGMPEEQVAERVRSRMATPREREVHRLAVRIRVLLGNARR